MNYKITTIDGTVPTNTPGLSVCHLGEGWFRVIDDQAATWESMQDIWQPDQLKVPS